MISDDSFQQVPSPEYSRQTTHSICQKLCAVLQVIIPFRRTMKLEMQNPEESTAVAEEPCYSAILSRIANPCVSEPLQLTSMAGEP